MKISLKSLVVLGFFATKSFAGYWPPPLDYCGEVLTAEEEEKIGMWLLPTVALNPGVLGSVLGSLSHISLSLSSTPITNQNHFRVVNYEGNKAGRTITLYAIRSAANPDTELLSSNTNPISGKSISREEDSKRWVKIVVSNTKKSVGSTTRWGKNIKFTPQITDGGLAYWSMSADFIDEGSGEIPLKFAINLSQTHDFQTSEALVLTKASEANFNKLFSSKIFVEEVLEGPLAGLSLDEQLSDTAHAPVTADTTASDPLPTDRTVSDPSRLASSSTATQSAKDLVPKDLAPAQAAKDSTPKGLAPAQACKVTTDPFTTHKRLMLKRTGEGMELGPIHVP